MGKLGQLCHLALWFFRARILGHHEPLQSVVFVTGGCDSSCRHCTNCKADAGLMKSFDNIVSDFRHCYDSGARILDVEGVNLVDWEDGEKRPKDIFMAARKVGFYNISTMIPGGKLCSWNKLDAKVDVLWVSITGTEDLKYVEDSDASLYMVINSQNYSELPEILEFMEKHRKICQIAFNFHTPFKGTEEMALSPSQREQTIQYLISCKKKGNRIMNTVSGLKNMLKLDFKRCCWVCSFVYCDGRRSPICIDDDSSGICGKCGFSMSGEMNAVLRFRPDTIMAGLRSRG